MQVYLFIHIKDKTESMYHHGNIPHQAHNNDDHNMAQLDNLCHHNMKSVRCLYKYHQDNDDHTYHQDDNMQKSLHR
jgi:hypothetical protein